MRQHLHFPIMPADGANEVHVNWTAAATRTTRFRRLQMADIEHICLRINHDIPI